MSKSVSEIGHLHSKITWQEVRQQLLPNEAAIDFVHYNYSNPIPGDSVMYAAIIILPDQEPIFKLLFENKQIFDLTNSAAGDSYRVINDLYNFDSDGSRLYQLIWKPIVPELENVSTIYCSPSGILNKINLGAIPVEKGKVISDGKNITLLNSLNQLKRNVGPLSKENKQMALLLGGVNYNLDSTSHFHQDQVDNNYKTPDEKTDESDNTRSLPWKFLPESLNEIADIKNILAINEFDIEVLSNNDAKESYFTKYQSLSSKSPQILHFATHSYFIDEEDDRIVSSLDESDSENAIRINDHLMIKSGLILAGANNAWAEGKLLPGDQDGIFSSYEISQLNLSETELVILSACETALGKVIGMEGVFGLQRAFKMAGAKNLIMSLWKVNDLSARQFTVEFYRQWLGNKLDIRSAYHEAQKYMRYLYPDSPYLWAGFVLIE